MRRELAVVLVSGGMDSCLTAAIANHTCNPAFLHLNYGQKTEQREKKAFRDIAEYFKVKKRLEVDMRHFSIGATKIYIGAVEEDSSGYPDCRESFFKSFNLVIKEGTKPETDIRIITPVIHMSKKQIVEKSYELNAPVHLTWSCYQNEKKACGICDSCALRLRGFQQAGIKDPIPYVKQPSYLVFNKPALKILSRMLNNPLICEITNRKNFY
jgi:7-cyano-7-deazaguanine synthase